MSKPDLDDVDIINIAQLCARREIAQNVGEDVNKTEVDIVKRMSDKALDWYIHNMVPVVGRPILKEKWDKIRKKN